jgi:hypothetical protein
MSDMHNDISDESLRKKLESFRDIPDESLWSKIQSGLPRDTVLSGQLRNYVEEPGEAVWQGVERSLRMQRTIVNLDRAGQLFAAIAFLLLMSPFFLSERKSQEQASAPSEAHSGPDETKSALNAAGDPAETSQAEIAEQATEKPPPERKSFLPQLVPRMGKQAVATEKNKEGKEQVDTNKDSRVAVTGERAIQSVVADKEEAHETPAAEVVMQNKADEGDRRESVIVNDAAKAEKNIGDKSALEVAEKNPLIPAAADSVDKHDSLVLVKKAKEPVPVAKEEKKTKIRRDGGLYFLAMPTLGYNQVKPVEDDGIFIESIARVSAFSPKRLGLRVELGLERQLSERFNFNIGVLYFQRKQTIAYRYRDQEHFDVLPLDLDSLVYRVQPAQLSLTFEYELKNIGILAGVNYTIKNARFTQQVGLAAELQRPLRSSSQEQNTDASLYLFGDIYYRISRKLSPHFDAMFQPTVNYALQLDDRLTAPFYVKPYGLGLNVGVYYRFVKR